MAQFSLKSLLHSKSGAGSVVTELLELFGGSLGIQDAAGKLMMGAPSANGFRTPVCQGDALLGFVTGHQADAYAVAALLGHLAAREAERRGLAAEVLHLYREVHLIDQLCEDLTALLDVSAVAQSAMPQARRLIAATSGGIQVRKHPGDPLQYVARFGEDPAFPATVCRYADSVLERGAAEIINDGEAISLILAPLRAKQRTLGLIVLANDTGRPYSAADLKLLNTIALQTAAAIENSLMCAEMVDAARYREQLTAMQREMETAQAIQQSLLPRVFPAFPDRTDFDIHAQMTPARAVGGDFFDFFLIDDERLGVIIGDVSGKGTPAALYMAMTHTRVKTVAMRGVPPEECMAEVNRILLNGNASSMFATCFYGILNTRTGQFRYSNAGHNPPYRVDANGAITALDSRGGTPLGMFPWKKYEGAIAQLDPGEALFLFTDGVPEAYNPEQEDFTNERLEDALRATAGKASNEVIGAVNSRVLAFTAGAPQSDDITMLSVRRATNQPVMLGR